MQFPFKRLAPGSQISVSDYNRLLDAVEDLRRLTTPPGGGLRISMVNGVPRIELESIPPYIVDEILEEDSQAIVKVTSTTAVVLSTGETAYPGKICTRDPSDGSLDTGDDCWVRGLNDLALTADYYGGWIAGSVKDLDYDSKSNTGFLSGSSGVSGSTWQLTPVAGSLGLFIKVQFFTGSRTVTSITFAGSSLTHIGTQTNGSLSIELWYLAGNAIAAGTGNIVVVLSGSSDWIGEAVCYRGVDQSNPYEGYATSSTASVNVTSITDGAWPAAGIVTDDTSVTAGQTSRHNVTHGGSGSGACEDNGASVSPGTTAMSYSGMSGNAAMVGYAIRPANMPVVMVTDPLTVAEDDGSPTGPVRTLQVDHTTMSVTAVSPGVAKLSALGVVTDVKVKVSSDDTTADYLENKVSSADGSVTLAELNEGGNETLDLSVGPSLTEVTAIYNVSNFYYNSLTVIEYVTLTTTTNNYSVSISVLILIINVTTNINLTGIAIGGGNQLGGKLLLVNVGAGNLTLKHQSGSSSAANRFYLPGAADLVIGAGGGKTQLEYGAGGAWYVPAPSYDPIGSLTQITPAANTLPYYTGTATAAGLAISANTFPARSGSGNIAAKPITDFGLGLVADTDPAAGRTTLLIGTTGTVAATGSVQGDAATLTNEVNDVTGGDNTKGVILNANFTHQIVYADFSALNSVKVYPPSGQQIGALGANNPETCSGGTSHEYTYKGGGNWRTGAM